MVKVKESKFSGLRFCRIFLWVAGAGMGILALLGCEIVLFPRQMLTVDSGAVHADAIVVLGGGRDERPQRAAKLFKQGEAPRILVSGFGDCEANVRLLEKNGVPANVITREGDSTSTFENAKFSIPLLRQMGAHRVIIVTSWYHSRRALTCFEHFAPDLQVYSRPSYLGYQSEDTKHQEIIDYVLEYIKLLIYWVWHGVPPVI
jgi:uncharacterized SAM-binding protein YcdF (DUF218 family)